jgi:transcriptional regulator with XRE-family HTH domain
MSDHAGETSTQNPDTESTVIKFLTYRDVLEFHLTNYKEDLKERGKAESAANNHGTALNKWLEYATWLNDGKEDGAPQLSASLDDPIGVEFGVDFEARRDEHLDLMKELGRDATTINSRKHNLGELQKSWEKLLGAGELPDDFSESLSFLIKKHDITQKQVAKWCGVNDGTVSRWIDGINLPSRATLKHITTIEQRFQLQPGTLVFKLPSKLRGDGTHRGETQNTPYRKHQVISRKKPFALRYDSFTPEQKEEWETLYKFYTDPGWVAAQGLSRHKIGWRTRQNNNKNSTAEIKLRDIENFYGFLCLPAKPSDPRFHGVKFDPKDKSHAGVPGLDPHLKGAGLDPTTLSLALFTDALLINDMINFTRGRSFGNSHNTTTKVFLAFCAQLTRDEKGFLPQFTKYGRRIEPQILTKEEWQAWCHEAHKRVTNMISLIDGSHNKQDGFNQTRDTTVEVIKPLVKEREHPISVLIDIAEGLRYDFKRAGTFEDKALLFRNMIMVRIVTSNPMRAINIAEMRYKVGSKGYEKDPTNLYKKPDGSYRLKYEVHELKNGAIRGRYDLDVNEELTEDLNKYFRDWRPRLVAADECDYVLRPSTETLPSLLARNPNAAITPMRTSGLSNIMRYAAQRYVHKCAGFGLHSARHFVATEYLKFNPGAYEIPAIALHDSEEMVKDTYSWVTPDDKIAFWNNHLSAVLREASKRREAA